MNSYVSIGNCTNYIIVIWNSYFIELWCNGNTADFGSVVPGSSPGSSTLSFVAEVAATGKTGFWIRSFCFRAWHKRRIGASDPMFQTLDNKVYNHLCFCWRILFSSGCRFRKTLLGVPSDHRIFPKRFLLLPLPGWAALSFSFNRPLPQSGRATDRHRQRHFRERCDWRYSCFCFSFVSPDFGEPDRSRVSS